MNVLIFGFDECVSKDVISRIQTQSIKIYIESNIEGINNFVLKTDFNNYDYVIGCGVYSGTDKKQIRIETKCSSQFRNNKDKLETLPIIYFFKPNNDFKISTGIGNSWCNLVSYLILKKSQNIKYTFLHIPKTFDYINAAEIIDRQLETL